MNFEEINFEDFEDVDFESEYNDDFEFTEEGEKVVQEFINECQIRQKELLNAESDAVKLPTKEAILKDIDQTVIVRENPKYVSDWNVTTEHSIQIKLLYKKHFVKAYDEGRKYVSTDKRRRKKCL